MYKRVPVDVSRTTALATLRAGATRDPRAAPVEIHKNVSIVETCRFYGVADALTTCRVPRSCQDCLQMPGCVVTYGGRCENASDPWMDSAKKDDYRTALTDANPLGTAYNRTLSKDDPVTTFFAGNATYCAASDSVCSACRANFRALARSKSTVDTIGTQFCVGANGCVCVAVCEVPELLMTRARDTDCYDQTPLPAVITTRDRPRLPSFSSRRRDPRTQVPLVPDRQVNATCGFHEQLDMRGCRAPRSCVDCLQQKECVIMGHKCVDMTLYRSNYDFRTQSASASFGIDYVFFPAVNTTYCSQQDATCAACREKFTNKAKAAIDKSTYSYNAEFCIGAGGCVCIELCENTAFFLDSAKDKECLHAQKRDQELYVVVAFLAFVLSAIFIYIWWRDRRPRRRTPRPTPAQMWRQMLDQAPQVLQLDLFGWRRYHQELRNKELELLAGAQDVSPVAQPMNFDNTDPTAPDFDEDDTSAPLAIDPSAHASAPVYRRHSRRALDDGEASAPSFDDE